MKIEREFTLLIAGPDHKCVNKMVGLCEDFQANIVISRWENDTNKNMLPHAQIVTSPIPSAERMNLVHNSQNIYLQVTTVLAGLEKVNTPYVIKVRSDEFFSRIKIMAADFNPEKLLSANIFVRDVNYKWYHISDHLFIGRTDRLKNAFSGLKHYIEMASIGGGFVGYSKYANPSRNEDCNFFISRHAVMKLISLFNYAKIRHSR